MEAVKSQTKKYNLLVVAHPDDPVCRHSTVPGVSNVRRRERASSRISAALVCSASVICAAAARLRATVN